MNKELKKNIVETLIFHQLLNIPCLTLFEIYKYLISPSETNILDVYNTLSDNSLSRLIRSKNGFYYLNNEKNAFETRILAAKISSQKIKKAKKIGNFLKFIPLIKSIAISGSVSAHSANPESDIDFFIISKKNRIWFSRFLTVFLTQIIGQRRHKNIIKDKICLNIYIADETEKYPIQNMANGQIISKTLPIYNKIVLTEFLNRNKWIAAHLSNFKNNVIQKIKPPEMESVADKKNSLIGNVLEDFMAKIFSKRILNKTPDAKPPFLVMNSAALLFHYPRSKNEEVMAKYKEAVALYQNKF